jgi:hypothetical protein
MYSSGPVWNKTAIFLVVLLHGPIALFRPLVSLKHRNFREYNTVMAWSTYFTVEVILKNDI